MIFKIKKIECVIGPAPNSAMMEFSFRADHWSFFFPDIKTILQKKLKLCRWEERTEGEITYEIRTDYFHHTLLCEDGEVHIDDNNYGLSIFVAIKDEHLFHRVENALRESGRFELNRPPEKAGRTGLRR
jgi:hypothetical protein